MVFRRTLLNLEGCAKSNKNSQDFFSASCTVLNGSASERKAAGKVQIVEYAGFKAIASYSFHQNVTKQWRDYNSF